MVVVKDATVEAVTTMAIMDKVVVILAPEKICDKFQEAETKATKTVETSGFPGRIREVVLRG